MTSQAHNIEEQTRRAKGFYGSDVLYQHQPNTARNAVELELIAQCLAIQTQFTRSPFLFVGAGYGRLIKELTETHDPRRVIAIELMEHYAKEIAKNVPCSENLEVVVDSYFAFPFQTIKEDRAVIFLNWSIIADFGSIEAIQFMFNRFKDTAKEVLVIGDMPHQRTYKEQIDTYHSKHPEELYGTFVMRHIENEGNFKSFLPTRSDLIEEITKLGYTLEMMEEYQDEAGNDRYMIGVRHRKGNEKILTSPDTLS